MTKQLALVIDLDRCVGCHACHVACKMENNIETEAFVNVRPIGADGLDISQGTYPDLTLQWLPISCMHCENPPCVANCPTGAMHKRAEDGIVLVNKDICIGCRLCTWACPYQVIGFDAQFPGEKVVSKCTLCAHRVALGMVPACVEGCVYGARLFGDINDPESEVSKLIIKKNGRTLLPEQKTNPAVHYVGYEVSK